MEDGAPTTLKGNTKPNSENVQRSRASSAASHKRTPSGGILSRLPFLRSNVETLSSATPAPNKSPTKSLDNGGDELGEEPLHQHPSSSHNHQQREMEPSMAAAIRQHKARKRKGSLRKTALLSRGGMKFERRTSGEHDRDSGSNTDSTTAGMPLDGHHDHDGHGQHRQQPQSSSSTTVATLPYEGPASSAVPSDFSLPPPSHALKLDTTSPTDTSLSQSTTTTARDSSNNLLSPESITSPISRYASTTSDDDGGVHLSLGASAADLTRRRSTLRNPVAAPPSARSPPAPPPHSSADTEYWGWIILFATWIVFVVGMGSCLGVWSWAWDVGETPYAPPELEDDPTLPIVGYYPALIVCTGVMAWVWCLVAWVGMKYFRHARFDAGGGNDDGD